MDIKNLTTGMNTSRNDINKSAEKPANVSPAANPGSDVKDRVTLTSDSSQVRDLEMKTQSLTIDNSTRIAELKAAIADGSYQVDANKVADKLMQTEILFTKANS